MEHFSRFQEVTQMTRVELVYHLPRFTIMMRVCGGRPHARNANNDNINC